MILAVSTSSPWTSLAVMDPERGVLWANAVEAPMAASGACLRMLDEMTEEMGIQLEDIDCFASDIGPGSFTGVRVGVTLAKTFGFLYGKPVTGATSFDLISSTTTVALPSKKGEFFVRPPGEAAFRTVHLPDEPYVGFGPGISSPQWPSAAKFFDIIGKLEPVSAMDFLPDYLIEPSISTPKKPFATSAQAGG